MPISKRLSVPGPDAQYERSERIRVVRSCFVVLSERNRELLSLRYERELTFRAIAERWGVSEQAVGRMHERILERIQRELIRRYRVFFSDQI